jgi:hypothetical protein
MGGGVMALHGADKPADLWSTPGPWLGMLMGFGTPLLLFVHIRVGWIAALVVLATMAMIAAGVTRRFSTEEAMRAYGSPALFRYNTRFLLATFGYIVGLLIAMAIYNDGMPSGPLAYAVSLLPTLPALAMIFVMGRYLVEETDEYLRHRASLSAIIGLGVVLVLGTVWGFLETFDLVPHVWAWWVVPAWAMGLGIGQGIIMRSEKAGEDDEEA